MQTDAGVREKRRRARSRFSQNLRRLAIAAENSRGAAGVKAEARERGSARKRPGLDAGEHVINIREWRAPVAKHVNRCQRRSLLSRWPWRWRVRGIPRCAHVIDKPSSGSRLHKFAWLRQTLGQRPYVGTAHLGHAVFQGIQRAFGRGTRLPPHSSTSPGRLFRGARRRNTEAKQQRCAY